MTIDDEICYRALAARDSRFDGLFFVGVKTTGIYCRPVCTAKTPARHRCSFYPSAALAEQAGFRPCLKCRPELAPGQAPIDNARTVARIAAVRIEAGALNEGGNLEDLASGLGLSARQLRRVMKQELGVTPIELAQTNRLLLAKRLIAETQLPMTQVAFAAGFESVRRFNALFRRHYRLTPGELRRSTPRHEVSASLRLSVAYRPPLAWPAMLRFLAVRAIPGVECVSEGIYRRTVAIGQRRGWLSVSHVPGRNLLAVELAAELAPALPAILARLRNVFDLDARPDIVDGHLAADPLLAPHVRRHPGLRLHGAFDGLELGIRAIVGQQISVRGASTLAGRVVQRFGAKMETPWPCLTHASPGAEALAEADTASIAALGMPSARATSLQALASAVGAGEIRLEPGVDPAADIEAIERLPGIGPWTAQYIAMRALRWPDAFPAADLGLVKASRLGTPKALALAAERWRPWRAYAAMHLWESLRSAG